MASSLTSKVDQSESQRVADDRNKQFYGRFTYPWPPLNIPAIDDHDYGVGFLNQELGDWNLARIPRAPRIWVAGCGTNQAVLTALRFPYAEIIGTDISSRSLEISRDIASQLGIRNLTLYEQSINTCDFRDAFDYIICTGVLHHNADPLISLAKLAGALKPDGIIETMVYNYYHRILPTTYQKAIRLLCRNSGSNELDSELSLTTQFIEESPLQNSMGDLLAELRREPEAMIADLLLQPIEHTYTIESFGHLLNDAGLEYWLPCMNQFDKATGRLGWNVEFTNPEAAERYYSFPDIERWQIANLLLVEDAPMIWFYVQRKDSSYERKSEAEVCDEFSRIKFRRYQTTIMNYINEEGAYRLLPDPVRLPSPAQPNDPTLRQIVASAHPDKTILEILEELDLTPSFLLLNKIRTQLTTPLFPYLTVASASAGK